MFKLIDLLQTCYILMLQLIDFHISLKVYNPKEHKISILVNYYSINGKPQRKLLKQTQNETTSIIKPVKAG